MVAVQRVIEPCRHPRGIAERGMLGDIFDPLAVNPDFSAIVEAVEKLLAGVGQRRGHAYVLPVKPKVPALRDCVAPLTMTTSVIAKRDVTSGRKPRYCEDPRGRRNLVTGAGTEVR